jgi:heme oxygenase
MRRDTLSARLRESTKAMHRLAERSGFMGELLAGRLGRDAYCGYLRNLHALYDALERELDRLAGESPAPPWILAPLFRRGAIAADLAHLHGGDWARLPLASATAAYVVRLAAVGRECPHRLAAHAYVRYLGDLSGGQAISGVIRRAYALGEGPGTAFYRFEAGGTGSLKPALREALDAYGVAVGASRSWEIVEEAVAAFARHRELFDELREAPAPAG